MTSKLSINSARQGIAIVLIIMLSTVVNLFPLPLLAGDTIMHFTPKEGVVFLAAVDGALRKGATPYMLGAYYPNLTKVAACAVVSAFVACVTTVAFTLAGIWMFATPPVVTTYLGALVRHAAEAVWYCALALAGMVRTGSTAWFALEAYAPAAGVNCTYPLKSRKGPTKLVVATVVFLLHRKLSAFQTFHG